MRKQRLKEAKEFSPSHPAGELAQPGLSGSLTLHNAAHELSDPTVRIQFPTVCGEFHCQPKQCLGAESSPAASGQSQRTATIRVDNVGVLGGQCRDRKPKSLPAAAEGRQPFVKLRQDS